MKVLSAASEAYPHIKTGGLADVVGALPAALAPLGVQVETIIPKYRGLAPKPGLYLVDLPWAFDRDGGPYLDAHGQDWPDNLERFVLFSQRVAERALLGGFDLVHVHDWQAAAVVACLDQLAARHNLRRPPVVLTVHNLAFQGQQGFDQLHTARRNLMGLGDHYYGSDWFEYFGHFNLLKGALLNAEAVTTVSETYAGEILTPQFGCGLEGILNYRASQGALHGIVNGLDLAQWDPARDPALARKFSLKTLTKGKTASKLAFQNEHGLDTKTSSPLLGLVSRLSDQKGIDLVLESVRPWLMDGGQLAVLGSGDRFLEGELERLVTLFPGQVAVRIGYSEALAHQIHGATDFFAVPSRFEPCGLTQMSAQRYASLPIVTPVGGLADTVDDGETGIVIPSPTVQALSEGLKRAFQIYADPKSLRQMRQAAMKADFSWTASAKKYAALYRSLIAS